MPSLLRRIEAIVWSPPPEDPAERKLLFKLDVVILSFTCLAYFVLALDVNNLINAYVSGMAEDVGFKGSQLTLAGSCWTAGYLVGQWPAAIALSSNRIPVRFTFFTCMIVWAVCTLGLAFVKNVHQVYALRFVQALFEAAVFSGSHYIYGSWYKEVELGARTAIFVASANVGGLFSGVMQGAILEGLAGRNGLKGWQWLFILDFIITVPVAFYGLIFFPDTPQTTKAFWLSADERGLAVSRLGSKEAVQLSWPVFRRAIRKIVTDWRWYMFSALFAVSATSYEKTGVYGEFTFWLKSTGRYTLQQVNYYPSIFTTVAIVSTYVLTIVSTLTGSRAIINPIMFLAVFISSVMLLVWNIGDGGHWFAYLIAGFGYAGQSTNFAWANTMCQDDDILRAVTLYSMNLFSNVWNLWYAIALWPQASAPRFRNGQIATIATGVASLVITAGIVYLSRKFPRGDAAGKEGGAPRDVEEVEDKPKLPSDAGDVPVLAHS
ncbi:hypothetical protein Q8F55_001677 [Vanrija albida]|uniref:Major facilitator superfamily (MFS) profile domain-containing protein n=1 Tax=Vanrija albida TaxID=181172 RepID=A0ABR3Q7W9_9TREE